MLWSLQRAGMYFEMPNEDAQDVNANPLAQRGLQTSRIYNLFSATIRSWAVQIFTPHYHTFDQHIFQAQSGVQHEVAHPGVITRNDS